jgi:hypothetical protein
MTTTDTILERVRAEYLEMPGLWLTFEQAQRLFGVEPTMCRHVLDALVAAKVLFATSHGAYGRLTDGVTSAPHATSL